MKSFVSVVALMLLFSFCDAQQLTANEIIKQSCVDAGRQHKNVFVIFHASWCGWCRKMDSSINDASCKKYFHDNYVFTHLTVFETEDKASLNTPGGKEFLTAHHAADQGIPAWFIFDKDGNLLADSQLRKPGESTDSEGSNVGCPANETEIDYFINVLKKTSKMTNKDIVAVKTRFAKNAVTAH
ncbi:MAG: thioredoxin family protein [Bacteroidetes bacterium]|nr:thioredoxin family protein [Bacteroidota bacterium]